MLPEPSAAAIEAGCDAYVRGGFLPKDDALRACVAIILRAAYAVDCGAVRPTHRAAPTLKETLREMYEQEFYQAGDKDYEVWLDRVVAWLAPRLASPVSLGAPTPAMIAAAREAFALYWAHELSPEVWPAVEHALRAALTAQEQK